MKIGILTYPLNNNYGCYLQSYALLHFLRNKGYDVEYINRRHNKPSWAFYLKYAVKTLLKNLLTFKWESPIFHYEWHYMMKKGVNMIAFFDKAIRPHTAAIYSTKKLKQICKNYDVIIVGSDQIWRAKLLSNVEDYFLSFLGNATIKRIAYAASFGSRRPGYTLSQISNCGMAIKQFKAVSLREKSGIGIIAEYGWDCKNIDVVLDPTLLLDKDEYESLLSSQIEKENIVFGYILDQTEEKKNVLDSAANKLNAKVDNILENVADDDFKFPLVEEWLASLMKARFVITDSFHGSVFSILFNIPFAVIINQARGAARFETLLNTFGLQDRIIIKKDDMDSLIVKDINWAYVNSVLEKKREYSRNFLIQNVKN